MQEIATVEPHEKQATDPYFASVKTIDSVFGKLQAKYIADLRDLITFGRSNPGTFQPGDVETYEQELSEAADPSTLLERATHRLCEESSRRAALEWATEYGSTFKGITVIKGINTVKHPTRAWQDHTVAIGIGIDGKYYAISPANHAKGATGMDRSRKVFQGNNWDELMSEIEKEEGCRWPKETEVPRTALEHTTLETPDGYPAIEFTQLEVLANETIVSRKFCSFEQGLTIQTQKAPAI